MLYGTFCRLIVGEMEGAWGGDSISGKDVADMSSIKSFVGSFDRVSTSIGPFGPPPDRLRFNIVFLVELFRRASGNKEVGQENALPSNAVLRCLSSY